MEREKNSNRHNGIITPYIAYLRISHLKNTYNLSLSCIQYNSMKKKGRNKTLCHHSADLFPLLSSVSLIMCGVCDLLRLFHSFFSFPSHNIRLWQSTKVKRQIFSPFTATPVHSAVFIYCTRCVQYQNRNAKKKKVKKKKNETQTHNISHQTEPTWQKK